MLRRSFTTPTGGTLIDEEQLLKEFMAPNPGLLLLPIIGESGTGKSHVVRWLSLRLPQDATRKVVYIPKYGTNLRRVIELILADMSGDAVDDLRAQLDKAAGALDEAGAPSRLLNEIAASIEDRSREPRPTPPPPHDDYRQWLEVQLPKLLLDNVFRSKLLESTGVIDRLVREALKGKQDGDKSEPFAFTIADLPLSVVDAARANKDVQTLFTQLIDSPTLRDVAVELLNENLGPAIRRLFGIGGTRLFDVMLSVRRELLARGAELVLLIEDFTILQGIQRELLDAITEAPVRGGQQVLCPLRVAMAVTTGYFASLADTVTTRAEFAGHVFSLDVPLSDTGRGVAREDILDFVGGYLNAARLGQTRLEEALGQAGPERVTHRRWVPNFCDECLHQDSCHEAFGTSREGFGLYPFNAPALERAVESRSAANFDPRRILGTVLRYTLDQHQADIRRGDFPSTTFSQHFATSHLLPLDPELVEDLRSLDGSDADRRVVLLTFWGGRPSTVVNLAPGIHEAFALPELKDAEMQRPRRSAVTTTTKDAVDHDGQPDLPTHVQRRLTSIDQWSDGTSELDQALAADLRRFLHAAVVAYVDWNDELLLQSDDMVGARAGKFFRQASIDIQNARGGGPRPSSVATIHLPASAESAALFRSITLFQHFGHWQFDRGDERLRRLVSRLDVWARDVSAIVRAGGKQETVWDLVVAATELLALTARVLNLPGAHSQTNGDLTNALLTDASGVTLLRNTAWDKLTTACAGEDRRRVRDALLARISARQGIGRPQAVDTSRVSTALTAFKRTWTLTSPPDSAPSEFRQLYAAVQARLHDAIDEELTRLRSWRDRVTEALDPTSAPAEIVDAVSRAAQAAMESGSFEPPQLRQDFEETAKVFRRSKYSVIREVGILLDEANSYPLGKLLSELAIDRSRPMAEIDRFVAEARQIIAASRQRARQQISAFQAGAVGLDGVSELQTSLAAIETAIREATE
jgi:hypothetical protein